MSDTIERRDYQVSLKQQTYDTWNRGVRNNMIVCPTGGGKSVIVSDIVNDSAHLGMTQCVIAHRNELVSQMSAHVARRGVPHRIIGSDSTVNQIRRQHRALFNGQMFVHPTSRCSVIGVDTLIARKDSLAKWAHQHDQWINDECFPAGVKITTPNGKKNIENIAVGDDVLAFDELNDCFKICKVTRLFKNPKPDEMVRLTTSGHHVIETTSGHPFWTRRGWVQAANLRSDDHVSMFSLCKTNRKNNGKPEVSFSEKWENILSKILRLCSETKAVFKGRATSANSHNPRENDENCQTETRNRICREKNHSTYYKTMPCLSGNALAPKCENLFQRVPFGDTFSDDGKNEPKVRIGEDDESKPYATARKQKESFGNIEANEAQTCSGGQRKTIAGSGTKTDRLFDYVRFLTTVRNKDGHEGGFGIPNLLQARHGSTMSENSNRSRWPESFFNSQTRDGREKRYVPDFVGLVSVEILKSGDNDQYERGSVYNIEVDELHTYIADDFVVHNCHHLLRANKWGKAVEMMPNARGLGVTATPIRADGQGLGREFDGVFDAMHIGPSMRELIDRHYLCDYEIVCPTSDLQVKEEEKSASGDWSNQTLRKAAKKSHIVGDVVENYIRFASGRKAIVFATDVETSNEIARKFNDSGIPAASLSAETPTATRDHYIEQFKQGKIFALVNVDLFDEGFDVPSCDVVIMARPTASLGKYRQQAGRALRYQFGKVALIIDMVSNVIRHGLPDKHIDWTLARRDKRAKQTKDPDDIPLTTCAKCTKPYERFRVVCPYCGHEKPLPDPRSRSVEIVEGDLVLLDRATLERMRQGTVLETPASIAGRVAMAAGQYAGMAAAKRQGEKFAAHEELRDTLAQWAGVERARGFSDREIQRKFFHVTGMDVLTALDATRPASEMLSLSKTIQQWWRR